MKKIIKAKAEKVLLKNVSRHEDRQPKVAATKTSVLKTALKEKSNHAQINTNKGKMPTNGMASDKIRTLTATRHESKPKGLFSLEYIIHSSPDVLFDFLSTPSGLQEWFAERVFIEDNVITFKWNNEEEKAKIVAIKVGEYVRYHLLDQPEGRYFEFRMQIDDLTGEVALMIDDFADTKEEYEEAKRFWDLEINDLHHATGSA